MPKTVPAGVVRIPGIRTRFQANVRPDPFDERDLEYRPRLEPLPPVLDRRSNAQVLTQVSSSCTGHAVATVVNTILGHQDPTRSVRVSPYMLYRAARRYDEFPGDDDAGSSLRGALKGWFHHGVALEETWPALDTAPEPDLDDESVTRPWRERPLGAFYRINPYRLDDVQSAIAELNVIVVSAAIHDGWTTPVLHTRDGRSMCVIERAPSAGMLGGHAFAVAGYNELGFLVQNSWGPRWGKDGFATLPYEDWLDSVYDAWVARPGVPHTPFSSGRRRVVTASGGDIGLTSGPDTRRLDRHVVNLGNDGRLSDGGKFVSTPEQLERIGSHLRSYHDWWIERGQTQHRDVVLYAHGGLNSEQSGLVTAEKHLHWWLNNRVYPITFAWQTGVTETILAQLRDLLGGGPAGMVRFDLFEGWDRFVEGRARTFVKWAWDEIVENAERAAGPRRQGDPRLVPGGTQVLELLGRYAADHPDLRLHLVGHSAGTLLTGALALRCVEQRLPVASLTWMAGAYRADRFQDDLVRHIGPGRPIAGFTTFNLSERLEQDDQLPPEGFAFYRKSLLYLVARALEAPGEAGDRDVPLTGLERTWRRTDTRGRTWLERMAAATGLEPDRLLVVAPSQTPADSRSTARQHGEFDDDPATMTSVLLRMLGRDQVTERTTYAPNTPLDPDVTPPAPVPQPAAVFSVIPPAPLVAAAAATPAPPPEAIAVDAPAPEAPAAGLPVSVVVPSAPSPDVAAAPVTGSAVSDILRGEGWAPARDP